MPIKILMPALSPTMTEGNLAKWLKKEGDQVKAGDIIAEIETDKAVMEVEAVDEGVLAKIMVPQGTEGVKVNQVIAMLVEAGEEFSPQANDEKNEDKNSAQSVAKSITKSPATSDLGAKVISISSAEHRSEQTTHVNTEVNTQVSNSANANAVSNRIIASPLARNIAKHNNLDLAQVSGTGPQGRIVKADVEAALKNTSHNVDTMSVGIPIDNNGGNSHDKQSPMSGYNNSQNALVFDAEGLPPYQVLAHTTVRKVIARRLLDAKQNIPHFYLSIECKADGLLALRQEANATLKDNGKISVNDCWIKACAIALMQVPNANAAWSDNGIRKFTRADVSVAVAIPEGLITPIVRGANLKSLAQISAEMKELISKARQNKLRPEEFMGGTFSISNLGMYNIKNFSAIINPPQAGILAIGAVERKPIVSDDGQIIVSQVINCTLSVDHRVIDGATGAQFLDHLRQIVENPLSLLL